jgi:hypothetical protein
MRFICAPSHKTSVGIGPPFAFPTQSLGAYPVFFFINIQAVAVEGVCLALSYSRITAAFLCLRL